MAGNHLFLTPGAITGTSSIWLADQFIGNGFGIVVGHTSQETVSTGDGTTDLIPELQVLGTGIEDSSLLLGQSNTTNAQAATLAFYKSANAAIGTQGAVADNEYLGRIIAFGDDGTDLESPAAEIRFVVDDASGPTTGEMGGSIEFYTTADGGETLTLAFTINNAQNIVLNGATTISTSTGDLTIAAAASFNVTLNAADADALTANDGTTDYCNISTVVATSGVTAHVFDNTDIAFANIVTSSFTQMGLTAYTLNVTTDADSITGAFATMLNIPAASLTSDTASTNYTAIISSVTLVGPTAGTNVILDHMAALHITDGGGGAGTETVQSGIAIDTLAGGSTNYAITIGNTDANQNLIRVGATGDPIFGWAETNNVFSMTHGLEFSLAGAPISTTTGNLSVIPTTTLVITSGTPAAGTATMTVQNTTDNASNLVATFGGGNRSIPANDDEAYLSFMLDDDNGTQDAFVQFRWRALAVANADKNARFRIGVMSENSFIADALEISYINAGAKSFKVRADEIYFPLDVSGGRTSVVIGSTVGPNSAGTRNILRMHNGVAEDTVPADSVNLFAADVSSSSVFQIKVEDGGIVRLGVAGGIEFAQAADLVLVAATASALQVTDGTLAYYEIDTRVTTDDHVAHTFAGATVTVTSDATTSGHLVSLAARTWNLDGGVNITTPIDGMGLRILAPIVASDSAVVITQLSTLYVAAPDVSDAEVSVITLLAVEFDGGVMITAGRLLMPQGADVASTNNLVLGIDGNTFEITGTTDINLISNIGWINGTRIVLHFTSTATVKDAQATSSTNITILLDGSADFTPTAGDNIMLELSEIGGVQAWREVGGRNAP